MEYTSDNTSFLNDSRILITGGTGSFGNQVVETLLNICEPKEIVVFSRDEKKQFDMRNLFGNKLLTFIIGDVRDQNSVDNVMKNIDYVFHAAALKQVPTCEFFPIEAVKTNILGTSNVLDAAENNDIKKVVVLSTDKAVYPINAMGMTKALLEKVMTAKARSTKNDTIYCGVRYGNVMFSRGSVLPLFLNQIKNKKPLTITNPKMTRFLLPLPIAIDLVLYALKEGQNGELYVRKSPSSTVENLRDAMIEIFDHQYGSKIIGIRAGEKMHETLVSAEEFLKAKDHGDYYAIENLEDYNYNKYYSNGISQEFYSNGYTSFNTKNLTPLETKKLLLSLKEIESELYGN